MNLSCEGSWCKAIISWGAVRMTSQNGPSEMNVRSPTYLAQLLTLVVSLRGPRANASSFVPRREIVSSTHSSLLPRGEKAIHNTPLCTADRMRWGPTTSCMSTQGVSMAALMSSKDLTLLRSRENSVL